MLTTVVSMATNDSDFTHNVTEFSRSNSLTALESLNYSFVEMVVVASVLLVIMVVTAFGNFLVGLSLAKYRSLQTVSNYLIGNLAVSDFLLATTVLPLSTLDECLGRWALGRAMCNLWLVVDVMYCTASIWNLLLIAFDRYTATMYPLWYRERRSPKQAAIYVALVWIVAVATCIPPLLGWNSISQNYVYNNATSSYHCVPFQDPSYVMYSACVSFYLPFLLTLLLYLRIFFVLRKRLRRMRKAAEARRFVRVAAASDRVAPPSSAAVRPTILVPSGLEMTSRASSGGYGSHPCHGAIDDSTSKSPLSSDSDDMEGFESCTITTVYSPSSPMSSTLLPSTPLSTPSHLTIPSVARRNGFENFYLQVKSEGENASPGIPSRRLELSGKSKSTTDFLSPAVCALDQRWRARSCHLDEEQGVIPSLAKRPAPAKKAHMSCSASQQRPRPKRSKRSAVKPGSRMTGRYERREMRATVRMSMIIGVFCGMWIGFFTVYVVKGLCRRCYVPRQLDAFFFWLGYTNSAINPILYALFNEEFRKAFQNILGCSKNSKTPTKR